VNRRRSPRFVALWLSLLLALTLAPATRAQETNANGLDAIKAEYHDMLDLFYRPLDPPTLLQAGWAGLSAGATRRGVAPPAALPDLPADPDAAFETFASAYSVYSAALPSAYTPAMAANDVEDGIADSVHEQHTHHLTPNQFRQFLLIVGGGQETIGVGVRLGSDPAGLVTDVAPGSGAANAGVQPGDVIVGADGRDLAGADTPTLAAALVGAAGSTLLLSVDRGDGPQKLEVTRGPFYFPVLDSRLLPDGVGYLRLGDFAISGRTLPNGTELLADFDRRLDELDAQGAQSWILDLRNNGGGSVQTADELLGRFLPDTVRSVGEADQRGHQSFDLASGRIHARQLPMAVLINGGSASASEVTAAALRDAHRAVLVGQKSAGAVASSELLPLPGGSGLQVAVATAVAPESNSQLDGVGVTPDVMTNSARTLADYRSGRDPQIEAAIAALASAPTPPTIQSPTAGIAAGDLAQLASALPAAGELPTNDRLTATDRWQRLDFIHPNELIDQNGGSPDPLSLQQTMRARGYQGTAVASYGATPGDLPVVSINVDLYGTTDGAHAAAATNDLPELMQPIDTPIQFGDETVAYRGTWLLTGSTLLVWRHGRVVYTVTYSDVPGFDRPDSLVSISKTVDARAQQVTVP